jgi:hypothetical protein
VEVSVPLNGENAAKRGHIVNASWTTTLRRGEGVSNEVR